jgi:hypothetical protein
MSKKDIFFALENVNDLSQEIDVWGTCLYPWVPVRVVKIKALGQGGGGGEGRGGS